VYEQFIVEAVLDGTSIQLGSRHLVALHHLGSIFNLNKRQWDDKARAQFAAFGRAIRHVQHDQLVFAVYELLKAGLMNNESLTYDVAKLSQLEQLRKEFNRWLTMDNKSEQAQLFRDVAAMTGLLYAFCDYARSVVQKSGGNTRIEVRKVIERCSDPYALNYTVAGNTKSELATLYRNSDMHFSYDMLKDLLAQIGVDAQEREKTTEKNKISLQVYFDDVVKAYTHLFETRYSTPKDQRDFVYQLKLSLHARFPDLIEPNQKGD
jgi:hypothetical protein